MGGGRGAKLIPRRASGTADGGAAGGRGGTVCNGCENAGCGASGTEFQTAVAGVGGAPASGESSDDEAEEGVAGCLVRVVTGRLDAEGRFELVAELKVTPGWENSERSGARVTSPFTVDWAAMAPTLKPASAKALRSNGDDTVMDERSIKSARY